MKHLNPTQMSAYLDRALSGRDIQVVEYHLETCEECREAFARLEALERRLATASTFDPGDEYFESFADRVEARLTAAERGAPAGAREPDLTPGGGLFGWLSSPPRVALAGGLAALVVAAGLVLLNAQHNGVSSLQRADVAKHTEQTAGEGSGASTPAENQEPAARPQDKKAAARERAPVRSSGALKSEATATSRKDVAPRVENDEAAQRSSPAASSLEKSGDDRAIRAKERAENERRPSQPGFAVPPTSNAPPAAAPAPPGSGTTKIVKPRATAMDVINEATRKALGKSPSSPKNAAPAKQGFARDGESAAGARQEEKLELDAPDRVQVCGRVVDDMGRPVAGADVAIAEVGASGVTGGDGRFCVVSSSGDHTLVVMSIGFQNARIPVKVAAGLAPTEVTLHPISVLEPGKAHAVPKLQVPKLAAPDTFSAWPPSVREGARTAQRLTDHAARAKSAPEFDRAADEWGRVLAVVRGSEIEIHVRDHLADTRYRAWEIEPTPARAKSAIDALSAYVAAAPLGLARDQAARRLARVKG